VTSRYDFVRLLAAAPGATALAPSTPASLPRDLRPDDRLDGALVLSGGGSNGAYEAGVIGALVRVAGVADGERLPMFQAVLGTSIGSLNAYFVATGQYAKLATLWHTITNEQLFRFKRKFAKIVETSSGVLDRLYQAVVLERGLVTDVEGVLDRDRVGAFIARVVDPDRRMLIPLIFTATNLSAEHAEVFYRAPAPIDARAVSAGEAAIQSVIGPDTRAREAVPAILAQALLASTALPVLFDPVELTFAGVTSQFVDGGIADNTPIDIARILAKNVYSVLVDPPVPPHTMYRSALEIGFTAFSVAQRRILETALQTATIESEGKRLFLPTANDEQRDFLEQIYDSRIFTIRPASALTLAFADFDSQAEIDAAYARGFADGTAGWRAYARVDPGR